MTQKPLATNETIKDSATFGAGKSLWVPLMSSVEDQKLTWKHLPLATAEIQVEIGWLSNKSSLSTFLMSGT